MKISLFSLLLLFQFTAHAKLNGPKRYDYKGLTGFVSGDFYMANENFDNNGKSSKLPSSGEYWLADFPFGFRYVVGANLGFEAELKASYAQSKNSNAVTGATRTNSQIHEIRVSGDYLFETENFDLIPEVEVIYPFNDIKMTDDDVLMNEGVRSLIGTLNVQTEFGNTDFFSYIGYQNRDDGRSDLMPWSLGLGWHAGRSFFGARLFGFQSISDDEDKNAPYLRNNYINTVNAGAARFYGVNPSSIATEGLLFFQISKNWEMQLHAGLDMAGENYSKGFFGGATFVMDFGQTRGLIRRRKVIRETSPQAPRGSGIAVEPDMIDFREETNERDAGQEYFAPPPPPAPRVKPRAKPRTRVGPSDKQLQNSLDDAEMKIELKRKKGR